MTGRRRGTPAGASSEPATKVLWCALYGRLSIALRRNLSLRRAARMDGETAPNAADAPSPPGSSAARAARPGDAAERDQVFTSLDAQREASELFVASQAHRGWRPLPDRYDDEGFTGANLERPAFQRLMADIDAGKVDVVVVYKVDRLSRSLLDFARVMERFQAKGVEFVSVTQNFSTADAIGRLTLNILMSFAEFERAMIAERTRDKIAASRRRGKWTGGPVPLGFDVVDKRLVVNPVEAIVVREIFTLYIEYHSIVAVLRALNERGRTTKRHQARSGRTRAEHPWTKDAVLRVLKNPVYAGLIRAGDELVEGEHEAIIDRGTFEAAQALLEGRAIKAAPVRNPAYLLRGLLRCAVCRAAMTPASTCKKEREYRYYRCITRDKEGAESCPTLPLPAEAIEDFVVKQLRAATAGGQLAGDVAARMRERIATEREVLAAERRTLPGDIARLSAEGQELVATAAALSGPARRLVEDRLQSVGDALGHREQRLAEVERQLAVLEHLDVERAWVERALRDFDVLWEDLTLDNRVRLVQAVVERVEVDGPGERITVRLADLAPAGAAAGATAGETIEDGRKPAGTPLGASAPPGDAAEEQSSRDREVRERPEAGNHEATP